MDITEISIIHHVAIVLVLLWILSSFSCCHPVVYFISLIYLYQIHERYIMRMRRKLQYEERKQANQRRVLSDSETVRWLNHAVEKIWPICMEQIASQKILLPIIPWFLEKYKPWTAKKAEVQHMYLGRNPPMFTEIRVLRQSTDDDHLVLELGMNFLSADDMSAILAVKLRKRLGFGMWAKLHITAMHVEGKVLVGVKFLREWPFLGRLRLCFVEPPYFQMAVKPIFTHGLNVTELPGIAGWLDKLLAIAFEQTLVEPNMLVVDVEKFVAVPTEGWFSVDEKEPIAYAKVEVIEGADMKPSDPNGLADPYVKGQLGPYRFRTKIQKKTLTPKWQEEFKIPICTWESSNVLALEVRDKDHFVDDTLGDCSINFSNLRDGQRHDMWLPLQNIKMGRLHLAVTLVEVNEKEENKFSDKDAFNLKEKTNSVRSETAQEGNSISTAEKAPKMADNFEPIDIEGQQQTGIWVHHPGSNVSQAWEPRKGKNRHLDTPIRREDNESISSPCSAASELHHNDSSSNDENPEGNKKNSFKRTLQKIGSVFHRSPRKEDSSSVLHSSPMKEGMSNKREPVTTPRVNLRAVGDKQIGVKLIVEDNISGDVAVKDPKANKGSLSPDKSGPEIPSKGHMKGMGRSILKHAGKSAHSIKNAMSRKGSNNSKGDSGSTVTEMENSDRSNSSEEESISPSECSPTVTAISIDSAPISRHEKESPTTKDQNVRMSPSHSSKNIEEPKVEEISDQGVERTENSSESIIGPEVKDVQVEKTGNNDMGSCIEVHHEGLVDKSSNSRLSEGTLELKKT